MCAADGRISGQEHRPPDRAVAELATRQYGVVARRQLIALGLSRDQIDKRRAAGRLIPLHRAVYAVGHEAVSGRGRWMAAVLACGPKAVLSHRDAADLWGIRRTSKPRIDVTTTGSASRGQSGIALHRAELEADDQTTCDAIPTTTLARTLLDLACLLPLDAVVRALEEAERQELIDLRPIHELLERANGHRGAKRLAEAIHVYDPRTTRTRSELERAFVQACARAGIPAPRVNAIVHGREVDALWPAEKLVVELDGYAYHATRAAFERDRERDAHLLTAGYRTLRVTARRLDREPAAVLAAVRTLLESR